MRGTSFLRVATAAALLSLGTLAPAKAAGILEKLFFMPGADYSNQLPPCESALGAISVQFAEKERRFWNLDLMIISFERVHQVAYNAWAPGTIPRRYCRAEALISDGRKHRVNYLIGEDTGMIGMTWGVEWCVVGLDRNWAYNPRCKMAQP